MADIRPALAALLAHLNRHPNIAASVVRASTNGDSVDVHASGAHYTDPNLPTLAAWLQTFENVDHVQIGAVPTGDAETEYTHIGIAGTLGDTDVPVEVRVLLDEPEADLLAANTRVERDATFPVELLLRLTSVEHAEAVTR